MKSPALLVLLSATWVAPARAAPSIVATLPDLAAIARELCGPDAEITALSRPNQDPHYVDPRPSLMLSLNKADLLIINGLELEVGWLPPLQVNSRNPKIQVGAPGFFDASTVVTRRGALAGDRSQGDIHTGGNPHFTFDPRAAKQIASALAKRLAALDADHAADYDKRLAELHATLDDIIAKERARFAAIPADKRRVVVYHESLPYLEDWLGLEQVATVEPLPGIAPTPSHVAKVLSVMRKTNAHIVMQEDYYSRATSETLAKLAKGAMVIIPGGTQFHEGERYTEHLLHITGAIYDALSK